MNLLSKGNVTRFAKLQGGMWGNVKELVLAATSYGEGCNELWDEGSTSYVSSHSFGSYDIFTPTPVRRARH